MTNVVQFPRSLVGDGIVVDVSDVLDGMKQCERVFVIGVDEHGDL